MNRTNIIYREYTNTQTHTHHMQTHIYTVLSFFSILCRCIYLELPKITRHEGEWVTNHTQKNPLYKFIKRERHVHAGLRKLVQGESVEQACLAFKDCLAHVHRCLHSCIMCGRHDHDASRSHRAWGSWVSMWGTWVLVDTGTALEPGEYWVMEIMTLFCGAPLCRMIFTL